MTPHEMDEPQFAEAAPYKQKIGVRLHFRDFVGCESARAAAIFDYIELLQSKAPAPNTELCQSITFRARKRCVLIGVSGKPGAAQVLIRAQVDFDQE